MKLMVVGGGGREHTIIKMLNKSSKVDKIYALPGNGGMSKDCERVDIKATDLDKIVDFAVNNKIDYAVVAPDDPLVLGLVNRLNEKGIACFGPTKEAAIIEGSKAFSKDLMKKYNIPTARYEVFTDVESACKYIDQVGAPIVVKADGLALGKGVIIAETVEEGKIAVKDMIEGGKFGKSGLSVVIEEFLVGPEISVLAFCDGETVKPMVSSMDHKRALDGDKGLNTGGMGTIAPNPFYTKEREKECMEKIFLPTVRAMKKEGREFKGCLYFGLMATKDGVKVIEYNCRFGDPETQVVLPLLKSDLLDIMMATTNGTLDKTEVEFSSDSCACVVMASKGYPEQYEKGFEITVDDDFNGELFVAGAKLEGNKLLTNGGRVLGVVSTGKSLDSAINNAYCNVEKVHFDNAYYRKDIGKKALSVKE